MIYLQVLPGSLPKKARFKSNIFGSLGAGLVTAPNTIDFGSVFLNLGAKLLENLPVLITVLGFILVYIVLIVVLRRMDKRDDLRVSNQPFYLRHVQR